ncbi:hypothetical protein QQ020_35435 [Fulvivirgaceae bacterium BMA12]|uniref:Uncharacterized protein n=1 Tax=Agaribacillus aureus TaxID=3051825 RepID=A0ABT8LI08_9BACT|nr:hypothetical protein [Fulvivirgaceae bacterium BMA12]
MKTLILSISMILSGSISYADCSEWYKGSVRMSGGKVVEGSIRYCLDYDLVLLKKEEQVITLSPRKVDGFVVFDHTMEVPKSFHSLPFEGLNGYIRKCFFELLYHGRISLLNREYEILVAEDEEYFQALADKYYIMDEDGVVRDFSGSRKELLRYMKKKADSVSTFITEKQLDISQREDLMVVFSYYHSIQQ